MASCLFVCLSICCHNFLTGGWLSNLHFPISASVGMAWNPSFPILLAFCISWTSLRLKIYARQKLAYLVWLSKDTSLRSSQWQLLICALSPARGKGYVKASITYLGKSPVNWIPEPWKQGPRISSQMVHAFTWDTLRVEVCLFCIRIFLNEFLAKTHHFRRASVCCFFIK